MRFSGVTGVLIIFSLFVVFVSGSISGVVAVVFIFGWSLHLGL